MGMLATVLLIIAATVTLVFVAAYTLAYPWWRDPLGVSLAGWPLIVGLAAATWAGLRLAGAPAPGDGLTALGAFALAVAAAHRLYILARTITRHK